MFLNMNKVRDLAETHIGVEWRQNINISILEMRQVERAMSDPRPGDYYQP